MAARDYGIRAVFPHACLAIVLIAGIALTPILAQNSQRAEPPSRQCVREIVKLCGRDRSAIRSCLQEKADQLSADCRAELSDRVAARRGREGAPASFQRTVTPASSIVYGADNRQQIDIYEPRDAVDELPLIVFVHGGGWSMGSRRLVQQKPAYFTASRYYFASAGYRVLPEAPVEEQARDIGAAIGALIGQASAIGFDPRRIVLMGHSAGAHLAALVATDPQYAGEAFDAIKGVILLDGAGYDVAAQMARAQGQLSSVASAQLLNIYRDAFGEDEARQRALSPITHAGGRDAPHWLALYAKDREASRLQAEALVAALASAGADATALAIGETDHGRINRDLGSPEGAEQTSAVDAFLARIFP